MGGGQQTQGGANNAGAMGIYDPNYAYGTGQDAFNYGTLGKGLQSAASTYASGASASPQSGLQNYGGAQSMTPPAAAIPAQLIQNVSSNDQLMQAIQRLLGGR